MRYKITSVAMLMAVLLCWGGAVLAEEDMLGNVAPQPGPGFEPGTLILLPDGRRAVIDSYLPNGNIHTDIGIVLTPQGIIAEGANKGETVTLLVPDKPEEPDVATPKLPEKTPDTPKSPEKAEIAIPTTPVKPVPTQPATPVQPVAPETAQPQKPVPAIVTTPQPKQENHYTLAELLPLTPAPETKPAQPEVIKPKETPKTGKPKEQLKPEKPKTENPKEHPKVEKPKNQPQAGKKPEPKPQKAKPGQELRIPKEAAKNGDLTFLEGCWQGTRPEYYSKRTIRECFCFGANGKTGKRRVFDPKGGRQCIGSSRASLSTAGVLSVTSSGAACNDGERWGQAEMICRNSGPRTPCSWVFRDANNGRQAYEIPFVRVESCGR